MKVYQNPFESKKKVDKDKIEEKIEKINKVIISLEEDIKKTKSKRLERLLPSFIFMKKNYISDLK